MYSQKGETECVASHHRSLFKKCKKNARILKSVLWVSIFKNVKNQSFNNFIIRVTSGCFIGPAYIGLVKYKYKYYK